MLNYEKLNVKIGLEIHQELSGKKLFCSCSTDLKEEKKVIEIVRKINPSMGESGDVDVASLYEKRKNQKFVYYGYENEFCLVETDGCPPHKINQDALDTALEVAMLLKLEIPDMLQVMRKIITNGSVVSGFQRTTLVGVSTDKSYIKTSYGDIRIKDLYLEEDACKIIKKEGNKVYYSLSRAGIPLLEIGTQPDIKTPEQAKEAASILGMVLRSTGKTKRGLGTIRQDVNLSIKNGARVELKGFQDLRNMPKVIDKEIERQLAITKKGKKVKSEVRRVDSKGTTSFLRPMPGAARLYPETDIPVISITKDYLNKIKLPELISKKVLSIEEKYNLKGYLANTLIKEKKAELFNKLVSKFKKVKPAFIAETLVSCSEKIKDKDFEIVFENLNKGVIAKNHVIPILTDISLGKKLDLGKYKIVEKGNLEKEIEKLVKEKKDLSVNAIMGILMKKHKGKLDGKKVFEIIKKFK
jgi:Glu-tRNA(Gln) amidotransferase subunit E-like FAD-binding protein